MSVCSMICPSGLHSFISMGAIHSAGLVLSMMISMGSQSVDLPHPLVFSAT